MRNTTGMMLAWFVLLLGCHTPPAQVGGTANDPAPSSSGEATSVAEGTTSPSDDPTMTGSSSPTSAGESSSADGGSSSDGEPDDGPLGPFDAPVAVTELNSNNAEDDDPTLTEDLLEIYFASPRNGDKDVFVSTRASLDDSWDAPMQVDSLNSPSRETFPEVSLDGLLMLLASNRPGSMGLDIYYSRRENRTADWPQPVAWAAVNGSIDDFGATPSPDLTSVFVCRENQPGGMGQSDIWQAAADFGALTVQALELAPNLSTPQADCSVSMSQSGREIFLESTRPAAAESWNIWTATRENAADPWEAPVEVVEINSTADDTDPWLSPNRRTLYFASRRDGNSNLYMAQRR